MPEIKNQDIGHESRIQKWAPYLVLIVLGGSVVFYLIHFPNGLSDKQSVWGQFGDFVGGLVNPIIGFFTIWLLAVSLRQNHKALSQANEALRQARSELELTRVAIDLAANIQAVTEDALRKQIAIAEHAKDMSNAVAIADYFAGKWDRLESQRKSGLASDRVHSHLSYLREVNSKVLGMEKILDDERERLVKDYSN